MATSLFFYDLETSGFSPKYSRIMQFGGQRTDLSLKPLGKPHNILIKLSKDILPDPEAVLLTGITPQKTLKDGITEAEFLRIFHSQIAKPGMVFVGFNNIRFDDEFIRFLHFRNFYDPYEWHWKEHRSRWDLLDASRMARALRPDGMEWPFDLDGKPTNRLGDLTKVNTILHDGAHDALADVFATIEIAKKMHATQPKLFEYLLKIRDKGAVEKIVKSSAPFIYTSGKYPGQHLKTTAVAQLADSGGGGVLVFDLRYDPSAYIKMKAEELAALWHERKEDKTSALPIKHLKFNRCPAVAPLSTLDESAQKRLSLNPSQIAINFEKLQKVKKDLSTKTLNALRIMDENREKRDIKLLPLPEGRLYDGFISDEDKRLSQELLASPIEDISKFTAKFHDARLKKLVPLYKARNFEEELSVEEADAWQKFRLQKFNFGGSNSPLKTYETKLKELTKIHKTPKNKQIIEDLKKWVKGASV